MSIISKQTLDIATTLLAGILCRTTPSREGGATMALDYAEALEDAYNRRFMEQDRATREQQEALLDEAEKAGQLSPAQVRARARLRQRVKSS